MVCVVKTYIRRKKKKNVKKYSTSYAFLRVLRFIGPRESGVVLLLLAASCVLCTYFDGHNSRGRLYSTYV